MWLAKDILKSVPQSILSPADGKKDIVYRIRGNFRGLPIFAVFRGQYESAKIKIAKYFPISVKESSLEATSIFAAVTSSFPLLR